MVDPSEHNSGSSAKFFLSSVRHPPDYPPYLQIRQRENDGSLKRKAATNISPMGHRSSRVWKKTTIREKVAKFGMLASPGVDLGWKLVVLIRGGGELVKCLSYRHGRQDS